MSKDIHETDQQSLAAKAMQIKERGSTPPKHPAPDDQANLGTHSIPRPDYPPSGAFDAEGQTPCARAIKER